MDVNKLIGKSYFILKTLFGNDMNIPGEFADHIPSMAKMGKDGMPLSEGEEGEEGEEEEEGVEPWVPPGDQPLGDVVLMGPDGDIASIIREDSVYTADGKEVKTRKESSAPSAYSLAPSVELKDNKKRQYGEEEGEEEEGEEEEDEDEEGEYNEEEYKEDE